MQGGFPPSPMVGVYPFQAICAMARNTLIPKVIAGAPSARYRLHARLFDRLMQRVVTAPLGEISCLAKVDRDAETDLADLADFDVGSAVRRRLG